MMELDKLNNKRQELNDMMLENDSFFKEFGDLDTEVYNEGAIPKKYKELTGLSISIATRCKECILYHIQGCVAASANKQEIIEAIKIGVIGCGSITYPSARYAFGILNELEIL
jgi:AhpD family alkylhydroperoxidase